MSLSGQQITAGTVPLSLGGTGATTASAARTALGVDAAGTDNSTDVTLATVSNNYLSLSGQQITAGTVPLSLGGTGATTASAARTALGVDAAGTDNSTDVTLATVSNNYLSLSGQQITAGTVPLSLGGTGATTASAARTALGVDAAGTDNSTDVTLATVSGNYLSLSGQQITAGTVPLSLGGTGATTASAARTALGAIDGLTVKQDSTTNSNDATYTSITTLIFDYDAGLQVSNPSTGEAKITLGSHWKTIQIDGTNAVTPSGEETLNLVTGTGISITGNSGSTPQSLTFGINAVLNDLSNVSVGSPNSNQVLTWNGTSWVPADASGGATSLNGLSDVSVSSNQITFGSADTTAILPADDNGVDLGSASYSFKDAHIQGVIHATQIKTGTPTFTLPTADGSSGQFLKTDGNGTLSWGTASGGSSSFTGLSDTPSNFNNSGGKFLKVNSTPNAIEFASFALSDIPRGGASPGQVLKWSGTAWAPATDSTGSGGSGGGGGGSSTGTLGVYNSTGDAKIMVETGDSTAQSKIVLDVDGDVANLVWNGTSLVVDKPFLLGSGVTASSNTSDVLLVGSGTSFEVKKSTVALSSLLTTSSSVTNVGTLSTLTVSGNATFDTNTLFVNSSNNRVGIGTTSPDEELHVKASGDARVKIEGGNDSGVLVLSSNSNDNYIFTYTNGSLYVRTDGSHLLLADNGGNVGIGTTSPSYKLDVNGTGRFTGDLTTDANLTVTGNLTVNGTTTTVSTYNMVVEDSLIELNSGASSNTNDCGIVIERGSTGDNAFMGWDESADKFLMGTTTATGASTGNLSVTTGTLVANLEGNVTGNLTGNVTGSILTAAQTNITSVGTLSSLNVSGSGSFRGGNINQSTVVGVHLGVHSSNHSNIQMVSSDDSGGWIDWIKSNSGNTDRRGRIRHRFNSGTSGGMCFETEATERMRITNDGKLGIGTLSPSGILHTEANTNGSMQTYQKNINTGTSSYTEKRYFGGDNELRIGVSADNYSSSAWDNGWVYSVHKDLKLSSTQKMIFCAGGASTERMRIHTNGNVGIGTTSPSYDLDVSGDINFTGTLRQNGTAFENSPWTTSGSDIYRSSGKVGVGTSSPQTILDLKGATSTTYPLQLRGGASGGVQSVFSWAGNPWNSSGYAHSIRTRHNGSADAGNAFDFYVWQTSDSTSALGTKHVLTIDGPGVGIGTTSPLAKLSIDSGKIYFQGDDDYSS